MDTATRLHQSRRYQSLYSFASKRRQFHAGAPCTLIFLTPLLIAVVVPKTQGLRLPKILEQARSQLIFESQNGQRLRRMWRLTILAWLAKILGMAILLATLSGIAVTNVIATILGAELSSILPIHGLAGAGSYEAGGIIGSTLVGLSPILALEMTIQLHIYVLSLTAVFGILGVYCY